MILRRRGDTFERVIREHLGGQLFAREGQVDDYFEDFDTESLREAYNIRKLKMQIVAENTWQPSPDTLQLWRILERIEEHICSAPDREAVALRVANTRQGIERLWRTR